MNVALESVDCPLLVALNPDAFPRRDWLEELVIAADLHGDVATFGSLQINATNSSRIDGYGDHYLVWGQAWLGQRWPEQGERHIDHCFGPCAAAALYRTSALDEIGGIDHRFFCFYEDVDVSFRLRLAGCECAVVPSAVVEHISGASFVDKLDLAELLIARNQWWVLIRNRPALLLVIAVPGFALIHLAAKIKSSRGARLRGLWEGLCRTSEFLLSRCHIKSRRKISSMHLARHPNWKPFTEAK